MYSKNLGFSLIELMVALTIGVVLVGGALTVHIQSYDAHRVRVRGERIDLGYTDSATYDYADLSIEPNDNFRRMLLSKTLRFRNGQGSL